MRGTLTLEDGTEVRVSSDDIEWDEDDEIEDTTDADYQDDSQTRFDALRSFHRDDYWS